MKKVLSFIGEVFGFIAVMFLISGLFHNHAYLLPALRYFIIGVIFVSVGNLFGK